VKPITIEPDSAAADDDPAALGVELDPVSTWESVLAQPTNPRSAVAERPCRTARRDTAEKRDSGTGWLSLEVIAYAPYQSE